MCVEDEKKLLEEKLMNAILYKYQGDVCLILRSVKGEYGVKAKMRHIGCVTSVDVSCCENRIYTCNAAKRRSNKKLITNRLTTYESNIKLIAAMLVMGVGEGEMANLLAFFDLPHRKLFDTSSIPV
eukprot:14303628-Ditylum_brightwellii.AAC.1